MDGTYEEYAERVVDGAGHALDDHALGKAVVLVAGVVGLVELWVESLPVGEVAGGYVAEDEGGFVAFTKCLEGVGVERVEV